MRKLALILTALALAGCGSMDAGPVKVGTDEIAYLKEVGKICANLPNDKSMRIVRGNNADVSLAGGQKFHLTECNSHLNNQKILIPQMQRRNEFGVESVDMSLANEILSRFK